MSKKLIITGLAGVVCIAYYLLLTFFNIGIPCLFHEITGLLCPGCGITRMILAIAHLDFKSAFKYNQVIFIFSPVIIRLYVSWLKSKPYKLSLLENIIVYIMLIVLLIFGIIRNII